MSWGSETGSTGHPPVAITTYTPKGELGMPAESTAELRQRVCAALDFVAPQEGREAMRAQNIWLVREMTKTVKLEHLTADEIAVIVSALAPAHGRVLLESGLGIGADPAIAPVLALVRRDAAAQLGDQVADL